MDMENTQEEETEFQNAVENAWKVVRVLQQNNLDLANPIIHLIERCLCYEKLSMKYENLLKEKLENATGIRLGTTMYINKS